MALRPGCVDLSPARPPPPQGLCDEGVEGASQSSSGPVDPLVIYYHSTVA